MPKKKGRTALHIAAEYDNIGALEELVEAGALVNIRARDGSTPLHVREIDHFHFGVGLGGLFIE